MVFRRIIGGILSAAMLLPAYSVGYAQNDAETTTSIFVSPLGDDNAAGNSGSPLKTISAAQKKVREILKQNGETEINVFLRGGDYRLTEPLEFGKADSGENSVIYSAYDGEKVRIMGSRIINASAFTPVKEQKVLDKLPESSREKTGVYDLKNIGVKKIKKFSPPSKYSDNYTESDSMNIAVYFNGKEQTLARYPNGESSYMAITSGGGDKIGYEDSRADRWKDAANAYVVGGLNISWAFVRRKVEDIDKNNKIIQLQPITDYETGKVSATNGQYAIENLIEELDVPGEYYVDEDNALLYYYPPYSTKNISLEIAVDDIDLLDLESAKNIQFKGIEFCNVRRSAVKMTGCENITFTDCKVKNTMMNGICMKDCKNCTVTGSEFTHIGATGVILDGGDSETLEPGNNVVDGCSFCDFGYKQRTYCPGVRLWGVGNTVKNSEIHNSPHVAVYFKGNDHKILNNEIYNVVKETLDSGAIYTGQNYVYCGTEIAYNYIHDVKSSIEGGRESGFKAVGVYLDDFMSGVNIHHNLFSNVHCAVLLGGGSLNKVTDNIIVNSTDGISADSRGIGWARAGAMHRKLIDIVPIMDNPAYDKYEHLKELPDLFDSQKAAYPYYNEIRDNLLYDNTDPLNISEYYGPKYYCRTENNILADSGDLRVEFADVENGNYTIKKDSEILKELPELAKINIDDIGETKNGGARLLGDFRQYYPLNHTQNISNLGTYAEWESAENADKYVLTIAKDSGFTDILEEKEVSYNYCRLDNIRTGLLTQYWKVEAVRMGSRCKERKICSGGTYAFTSSEYDIVNKDLFNAAMSNLNRYVEKTKEGTGAGEVARGTADILLTMQKEADKIDKTEHISQAEIDFETNKINQLLEDVGYKANVIYSSIGFAMSGVSDWKSNFEGSQLNISDNAFTLRGPKDGSTVATYAAKPISRGEILCFDVNFDINEGWSAFGIQSEDTVGKAIWSGSKNRGFLVVIKKSQIELQKWDGSNTIYTVENTAFVPGEKNSVQFGIVDFGGGNRVILNINGKPIFDFIDYENPISDELYFSLYSMPSATAEPVYLTESANLPDKEIYAWNVTEKESIDLSQLFSRFDGEMAVNSKVLSDKPADNNSDVAFTLLRDGGNKNVSVYFREMETADGRTGYEIRITDDKIILERHKVGTYQVIAAVKNSFIPKDKDVRIRLSQQTAKDGAHIYLTVDGEKVFDVTDIYPIKLKGYFGFESDSSVVIGK